MPDPNDIWLQDVLANLARSEEITRSRTLPMTADVAPSAAKGADWKTILGLGVEGFASGFVGKRPEGPTLLFKKKEQERQAQREAEKMQIEKHGMALKVWEEILKASKIVSDPKIAAMMAESFSNTLGVLGQKYSKEDVANAIHNPKLIDDILRRHKDLGRMGLSKEQIREYDENPTKRKAWDEQFDKVWGKEMFTALLENKDQMVSIGGKEKKLSEASFEELLKEHPDVGRLTEEDKWQLNEAGYSKIKPKELIAAERKGTIGGEGLSKIQADIIRKDATKSDGTLDTEKAKEILKDMRTNPQGYESRMYDSFLKEFNGDTKKAREATNREIQKLNESRATGAQIGRERGYQSVIAERLDRIQREAEAAAGGKPLDPTTQQRVSDLLSARRQVANVEANYDKEFLGPIKGTQTAFEARRRVGSYIGSPLGEKETIFRQALADIKDMLLRARSGAQINEQEYKRLAQMLPAATDEEQVFKAGLTRFDTELANLASNKINLGVTPRKQLSNQSGGPAVGTIQKGYRFKGGDPARQENWERVQ